MVLLRFFGRKTLMIGTQVFIIGSLVGMWYFTAQELNGYMLWVTIAFICMFEFGPGPIAWLYISEVCNN